MRIAVLADVHLDTPFRWMPPAAVCRHRHRLRDVVVAAADVVAAEGIDVLAVAGDLYEHDHTTPDTGEFLRSTFERLQPVPVLLAPGNHDWYGPASLYHQVRWSPNVHVFDSDHLVPRELADGLTVWGAAHRAPRGTPGFLEGFRAVRGGVHLAVFHGSECSGLPDQGEGKLPHAPFRAEQVEGSGVHFALCGHYHRPTRRPRHAYPGNPASLALGDGPGGGLLLVDVADDGTTGLEWRVVAEPALHDVVVDVTGSASATDVRGRVAERLAGLSGAARVALRGDLAPEVDLRPDELADVAPWLDAVMVRADDLHVALDLDALAARPTVDGAFVRLVRDAGLTPDERRRVLLTGLRALAGRSDLDVA